VDRETMQDEYIYQYAHTWRVFSRLVNDFDDGAWLHTGRNLTTPARLSLHILQASKYYIEDQTDRKFISGKDFDMNSETTKEEDLPSRSDMLRCIDQFSDQTEKWLSEIDYESTNNAFPWAGNKKLGVVIFLLRHSFYHLGELSSLLNESKNGNVEDHFLKAL